MSRQIIHTEFVRLFRHGVGSGPVSDLELSKAERALKTLLPEAYRQFMRTYGEVFTPDILGMLVEAELDFPDLQNIVPLAELVGGAKDSCSAGLPDEFVAFANDSSGDLLCFERVNATTRPDDAPVWIFDHEFFEVSKVSDSFDEFLLWYVENLHST